jgi:hypothetical protein
MAMRNKGLEPEITLPMAPERSPENASKNLRRVAASHCDGSRNGLPLRILWLRKAHAL